MSRVAHYIALNMPSKLLRTSASARFLKFLRRNSRFQLESLDLNNLPMLPPVSNVTVEQLPTVTPEIEKPIDYNKPDERKTVELAMETMLAEGISVPIVINGREYENDPEFNQVLPFRLNTSLAKYSYANKPMLLEAINTAVMAQEKWNRTSFEYRIKIWEDAADLLATKYRIRLVAATVLGQAKTIQHAEDDIAGLIDILRFSATYLRAFSNFEPRNSNPTTHKNFLRLRGLFGFVGAISPFNSVTAAGNMAFTPVLMGNSVLWKPYDSAILSNWYIFQAFREVGLPDGVVNFVPSPTSLFSKVIASSMWLAGINFSGSMGMFKDIWRQVAHNLNTYETIPRLVGDCGGKNFHFVHASADVDAAIACTLRSSFEYAGQMCSSCSMLFVPSKLWLGHMKAELLKATRKIFVNDANVWDAYYSAVINERAFNRIRSCFDFTRKNKQCKIIAGGECTQDRGYFVQPTIVEVSSLENRLCKDELQGPVLCVYVYKESEMVELICKLAFTNNVRSCSIFANESSFIKFALEAFSTSVGHINLNDKSTNGVDGQCPSGGRLTGTNDKPGSPHYLLRWTSPVTIREMYASPIENCNPT